MRARIRIDLGALCGNYRSLAEKAEGAAVGAAIKANAYGLGATRVGAALAREGCGHFFAASMEEAEALRPVLPDAHIYVLHGVGVGEAARFHRARLIPKLNTPAQVARWRAEGAGRPCTLHLDTGMHRLGLGPEDARALLSDHAALQALGVIHVMSHLACSDRQGDPMNAAQRARFDALTRELPAGITRSLSPTGGIFQGRAYHYDMVRPGIGLYGASPDPTWITGLEPVVTLEAPVLALHDLPIGESVGYGGDFCAPRAMRLATIALGYGDGVPRRVGGRWAFRHGDRHLPVVGRVSMDLITLDATGIKDLAEGDYVRLFGRPGELEACAAAIETIPYELLTGLSLRAIRSYEVGP